MTVRELLEKTANISQVNFYDKRGKFINFMTVKVHLGMLLCCYGNMEVVSYKIYPTYPYIFRDKDKKESINNALYITLDEIKE